MAVNPENFDQLLKLLALKRHEQPPPGYFDQFARGVIVRLKAGEAKRESWLADIGEEASWLQKIWSLLEAKPVLAGAFGAAVSGLLLAGIIYAQRLELPSPTAGAPPPEEFVLAPPTRAVEADQSASALLASSTNPVINPVVPAGLFDGVRLKAEPVSLKLENK